MSSTRTSFMRDGSEESATAEQRREQVVVC